MAQFGAGLRGPANQLADIQTVIDHGRGRGRLSWDAGGWAGRGRVASRKRERTSVELGLTEDASAHSGGLHLGPCRSRWTATEASGRPRTGPRQSTSKAVDCLRLWNARTDQRLELLQGTLDMLILRTLQLGPRHGHGIGQAIRAQSDDLLKVEARLAISRTAPSREARLAENGVGRERGQSAGEVLPAHRGREGATASRAGPLVAARTRHQ